MFNNTLSICFWQHKNGIQVKKTVKMPLNYNLSLYIQALLLFPHKRIKFAFRKVTPLSSLKPSQRYGTLFYSSEQHNLTAYGGKHATHLSVPALVYGYVKGRPAL